MREHYYLKTREQILAEIGSPKFFSELDLRHAYWQIPLTEESRLLTTFNTHKGRYCFNVGPFGLNPLSEACQRRVEQHVTEKVPHTFAYQDNIIIVGYSEKQHDETVDMTLRQCEKAGITLNFDKCKFKVKKLRFLGEFISCEGVQPDPDKVKVIQEWKTPYDVKSLQSFFGMINFVGKFLPNLASRTQALRSLLKKNSQWVWDQNQEREFQDMKKALSSAPILVYYDPAKEHKISSDASKSGIGTVLLQKETDGWHPVHYGARSLTKTETKYAPIEREALGFLFGVKKFHQYVFGKKFVLETDHKPLISICQGYLNEASARIQSVLLKLQKYDFDNIWVPRKFIMMADSLSKTENPGLDPDTQIEIHVNEIKAQIPVSDEMWEKLARETENDAILDRLRLEIQRGEVSKEHSGISAQLSVINGVIFKGMRIYVPKIMRSDFMAKAHEGHLGREKTKRRARSCIYWQRMNEDIDHYVSKCETCCKFLNNQPREPLIQDTQIHPWFKVGLDILTVEGKDFLIVVDYMSNYPELKRLHDKSSTSVVKALKPIFARFGIPSEVTSDNVPFNSREFIKFSQDYGFSYRFISPRDSNANGKAESGVKIVKQLLKKSYDDGSDPYLALMSYRSAPLECGKSPAELLFGRNIRTRLPMLFREQPEKEIVDKIAKIRNRQKKNYDKGTRLLDPLVEGDVVRISQPKGPAIKARVIDTGSDRSYIVETELNKKFRRNRNFLTKTNENFRERIDYDTLLADSEVNLGDRIDDSQNRDTEKSLPTQTNYSSEGTALTDSETIPSNQVGLRRSTRIKNIPDRLSYS